jgi:hypothetical protein
MTAQPDELGADNLAVSLDELAPGSIAELGGRWRRTDDLGDEQRHQGSIVARSELGGAAFGEERLDGIEDLIGIDPDEVVGSR